jgi:SPP1 family phage portal protein
MLTKEELKLFIDEDMASVKKQQALTGARYYDAEHDIKNCRLFFYNSDGQLVEDTTRANVKIPHPFFTELTDQATQYILSGDDPFVVSDDPDLQDELDSRFNNNDDFRAELSDLITDCQTKGFAYMYALKDANDRMRFTCADAIGVIEVEGRFAGDGKDHVIYWYIDRIDKDGHRIKKIQDWDDSETHYYTQDDEGEIQDDADEIYNPRPHVLYTKGDGKTYGEALGFVPFFRLDNNKKQFSNLKPVKELIDDYDMMASSLSNNLIDFDHPLYVVKGFQGHNLDELQQNLKTKKMIGTAPDGGVEIHTVDVPFEARKTKMELDEKNIYRFGFGLNLSGLKDTSATTNIAIKAAYSLLDLRCNRLETQLKRFLRKVVNVVIDEINKEQGTDYQSDSVHFEFTHEVMSNEQENATIEKTDAEKKQVEINTLLSLQSVIGDEQVVRMICDILDIDYDDIKDQIPKDDPYADLESQLGGEGNGIEQPNEGSPESGAE